MTFIKTRYTELAWLKWQKIYNFFIFAVNMELITERMYTDLVNDLMDFKGFAEDCEEYIVCEEDIDLRQRIKELETENTQLREELSKS